MQIRIANEYNAAGLVTGEVSLVYEYQDGERTDNQVGFAVTVTPMGKMAELATTSIRVKLPIDAETDVGVNDIVQFEGLTVTPYVREGSSFINYAYRADNLKVISHLDLELPGMEETNNGAD
ncbi:hypothetical protein ACLHIM_07030 [Ligilactobacillus sp. LYQ112]|uniref:hypothetical protein n=1 Tax=Ligilactobacillus sp. LYQ112 TaxID=3391060 RepID=UPI003983A79B